MLPRSSSTSSCIQSSDENLSSTTKPLHHYESLQNLQQSQRPKSSHPLTVDNNHLNLPIVPHPKKDNLPNNEKKSDQLRRTIVQDDIENIQERLNEMLIAVPSTDENTPQNLTTEYFTPKISIEDTQIDNDDDHDRKKKISFKISDLIDRILFFSFN